MAHQHAFNGDTAKLRTALKKTDVSALSKDRNQSLLYIASRFGHLDCVKLLIEDFSADVHMVNGGEDKSTALHGAAYGGHADIVAYLLDKGAKVVKNGHGETPQTNAKDSDAKASVKTKMARLLNNAGGGKKKSRNDDDDDNEQPSSKAQKKKDDESAQKEQTNSRFYNEKARRRDFDPTVKRDKYGNVAGTIGDLGNDGAFNGWSILLFNRHRFGDAARRALKQKGWSISEVKSESDCEKAMKTGKYDVVIVISTAARQNPSAKWVKAMVAHHDEGKGLLICGDNEPFFAEANAFLVPQFSIKLIGNTPGNKVLKPGNPKNAGEFDATDHMITAGIDAAIYEGVTICYPDKDKQLGEKWHVFGTSSDNHPVLIATSDSYAGGPGKPGRIVIDCGFTKFFDGDSYFGQAATDRYLTNTLTWLANVERSEQSAKERNGN